MKNLAALSEDFLMEQYSQPAFLPPLWRVIFQEAMRGHHIIFSRTLVQSLAAESAFDVADRRPNESLEEFCVHLFAAPDLKSIRTMISFLSEEEQKQLFAIYARLMRNLRIENKNSMN